MSSDLSRIYLSSPHMGGEELEFIKEAFDKNWIAPLGANVNGFEKDLQEYTGRSQAAVVTSGTAAIHLGLILCGVKPGDEVICQSFTFAATANPIRYQGASPVFVDSEPETWNMDPDLLEKAILDRMENGSRDSGESSPAAKPKAIIVVHLYGMPAKMDQILKIGEKYDIPVIEDAAEALGSSLDGRKCGSLGKISALSFNGNKIITTSGGGALLSDDAELVEKSRFLATQARDDAPHYQHSEVGYNYRMSNIVAGIGRGQMKVLDEHINMRRANHQFYFEELNGTWLEMTIEDSTFMIKNSSESGIYFLKEPDGFISNRWLTTILVNPEETGGISREDIRIALEKENIECRPLWKPMHLQPLYNSYPFYTQFSSENSLMFKPESGKSIGLSDILFEYGLCLPSGSNMSESDRKRVIDNIHTVLN